MRAQSTLRTVCPRPSLPHVESGLAEEPGSDRSNRQFSERGEGVGLAQPTVSQHLQKLEEQVGVTLVQRSRSGCQPTTRALAFMPHATALLDMHARR